MEIDQEAKAVQEVNLLLEKVRKAQEVYSTYTQEQVDKIFRAAAIAANKARIPLAQEAVAETGMGVVEDKVIKNHYAAEYIYNKYRYTKTCGIIEEDEDRGYTRIAEPIGIIAGIVPCTNPTATAIFKSLIALKTRNGIIFSPHPRAKKCTIHAAQIVLNAAIEAGAPKDIIAWIEEPSIQASNLLRKSCDIILATGGPGMVSAAYSSGKPAIGVGPGNAPAQVRTLSLLWIPTMMPLRKNSFIVVLTSSMLLSLRRSARPSSSMVQPMQKLSVRLHIPLPRGQALKLIRRLSF